MSFLRSSLLSLIVSFAFLTGYVDELVGACCAHDHEQAEHGTEKSADSDGCQCICHQVLSTCTAEPMRVVALLAVPSGFVAQADEFPPDSVPVGIDHPPQLA